MPTDVAAPLPQLDLPPNATITVTLDDPLAVLTSLVVHGWQDDEAAIVAPPNDDPIPQFVAIAPEDEQAA